MLRRDDLRSVSDDALHAEKAQGSSPRPTQRHFLALAVAWTVFVAYGSWVPLDYHPTTLADALDRFRNLPPVSIDIGTRADWAANVLLFIPLTFLWMGGLACDRGPRARLVAAAALIPIASFFSFAVELGQFWFIRNPAKNDVVAESIGGVIGVALWFAEGQRSVGWLREYGRARTATSQITWLLQAYVFGFVVFSLLPMDLTISVSDLYFKYKSGRVVLIPFTYEYTSAAAVVYQFFADIATFVPVGAWLAARERDGRRTHSTMAIGLVGGFAIAAGLEIAQFLVLSRYTDTTDIVLGTIGTLIGVRLARQQLGSPAAGAETAATSPSGLLLRRSATIVAYTLFLMIGFWFPFDISWDRTQARAALDSFFRVPFFALYWGSVYNATTQAVLRVILFAPLGAMWGSLAVLARSAGGRHLIALLGFLYTFAVAFGIELVQVLMPARVADSTEVVICTAAGLLGLWLRLRLRLASDPPSS